jgi:hypothetical protein
MSAIQISVMAFACIFGGALIGMFLPRVLRKEYLSGDSSTTIKVAIGLVITMTGIVLGMLVNSARNSYYTRYDGLITTSADIILLDRLLANYGPDAQDARSELRSVVQSSLERVWGDRSSVRIELKPSQEVEGVYVKVLALPAKIPEQNLAKTQAISLAMELMRTRWLILIGSRPDSMSTPMLVVMTSWLTAIFVSFGLFAPRNPAVLCTLFVSALAVSTAIFLIVQMNNPFTGILKVPEPPMRAAFDQLGK